MAVLPTMAEPQQMGFLSPLAETLGVEKLRVESRLLPPLEYDLQDPDPGPWSRRLKPSVQMVRHGQSRVLYEPYGPPGGTLFPVIVGGAAAVLLGAGFALGKVL